MIDRSRVQQSITSWSNRSRWKTILNQMEFSSMIELQCFTDCCERSWRRFHWRHSCDSVKTKHWRTDTLELFVEIDLTPFSSLFGHLFFRAKTTSVIEQNDSTWFFQDQWKFFIDQPEKLVESRRFSLSFQSKDVALFSQMSRKINICRSSRTERKWTHQQWRMTNRLDPCWFVQNEIFILSRTAWHRRTHWTRGKLQRDWETRKGNFCRENKFEQWMRRKKKHTQGHWVEQWEKKQLLYRFLQKKEKKILLYRERERQNSVKYGRVIFQSMSQISTNVLRFVG